VSRVAGEEAELIEATDAAQARRRPQNGRRTTTKLHGCACSAREVQGGSAEGATERVSGRGLQKRGQECEGVAGKCALWAHPRRGARAIG
jgi:hypothetical protein